MKKVVSYATGVVSTVVGSVAMAAPPDMSSVATVFTDAATTSDTIFGYAMPVIGTITLSLVGIKLFKRYSGKM